MLQHLFPLLLSRIQRGRTINEKQKAFTLIELLIVVAIVGILSTVVFTSVQNARIKAKAAKFISDAKQIEKAFAMWAIDEGRTTWWHEDTWGAPTDEPEIDWLIANTPFGSYLSGSASIETNHYVYDNDGDTFDTDGDGCADAMPWQGVFLNVWDASLLEVIHRVDEVVDRGDGPTCGKIVWDQNGQGGYFIGYRLGNNSQDMPF